MVWMWRDMAQKAPPRLRVLRQMQRDELRPSDRSYTSALSACKISGAAGGNDLCRCSWIFDGFSLVFNGFEGIFKGFSMVFIHVVRCWRNFSCDSLSAAAVRLGSWP